MATMTLQKIQANNISQNEYWSKRILEMIKLEKSNFVFSNLGTEVVIPLNEGTKTFSIHRYNSLPVIGNGIGHKLTEGTAPNKMQTEAHKVQGTVNQYGVVLEETDVAADIHFDNIKNIYQPELARHAAEVRERNIIASFGDAGEYYVGTNNSSANDLAANETITFKDLRTVALAMQNLNRKGHSKFGGKFVAIMHPNVMNDLLDDPVLVNKLLVPGNENTPIKQGTLASYTAYGMAFKDSLICPRVANSSSVGVYTSYVLGKDPYMVLSLGSSNVKFYSTGFGADKSDPLGQKSTFGYKMWTGAKIIDPIAICKVYSASSYDVSAATLDIDSDTYGATADQTGVSFPEE